MAIKLTTYGNTVGLNRRFTVRLTRDCSVEAVRQADLALVVPLEQAHTDLAQYKSFAAVITDSSVLFDRLAVAGIPAVRVQSAEGYREGYIVTIDPIQVSFEPSFGLSRLTTPFSPQIDATVTASCALNHRKKLMMAISSKKTSRCWP